MRFQSFPFKPQRQYSSANPGYTQIQLTTGYPHLDTAEETSVVAWPHQTSCSHTHPCKTVPTAVFCMLLKGRYHHSPSYPHHFSLSLSPYVLSVTKAYWFLPPKYLSNSASRPSLPCFRPPVSPAKASSHGLHSHSPTSPSLCRSQSDFSKMQPDHVTHSPA